MRRRLAIGRLFAVGLFAVGLLLLAAAAPVKSPAKPEDIAEQLGMLAFDANPAWAIPARTVLGRWAGPMRVLVFGRASDRQDMQAAVRAMARPTGLSIRVIAQRDVARSAPNLFLVVDEHLGDVLQGPLHAMLSNAFLDDEAAVAGFLAEVVAHEPCWVLPVWADASRVVLKAGVIGADAGLPRAELQRCLLRALGGAVGLLGPGAFLPGSAFAPEPGNARLSREDERMLRVLYGRAVLPGMTRAAAEAAARRALAVVPRKVPPVPRSAPKG